MLHIKKIENTQKQIDKNYSWNILEHKEDTKDLYKGLKNYLKAYINC